MTTIDRDQPVPAQERKDNKAIRIGAAVVPYATAACPVTGDVMKTGHQPEGWVLPGGERTQDQHRAVHAAMWIDNHCQRARVRSPASA